MAKGLKVQFNKKAKIIKTEDDIKVGMRTEADGSKIAVRGGKIISRYHSPAATAKREEGRIVTPQMKQNEFRKAAAEYGEVRARKHKAMRASHKPENAPKA